LFSQGSSHHSLNAINWIGTPLIKAFSRDGIPGLFNLGPIFQLLAGITIEAEGLLRIDFGWVSCF
jgi:hypothetical protein